MYRNIIMAGTLGVGLISSANAQGVDMRLQALQNSVNTLQASVNTLQTSVNSVLTAVNGETLVPYQQALFSLTSCQVGDCSMVFPAVTAKTLILHASCSWNLATNGFVVVAGIGSQNNNASQTVPFFANQNNPVGYAFNAETYLFVDSGDSPRIDVFALNAGVSDLKCTISGKVP